MAEEIDIRYVLNSPEFEEQTRKVNAAIHGSESAVNEMTEDLKQNIDIQKRVIKDLEKSYKEVEKSVSKMAPGAAQNAMRDELAAIRVEIDGEKRGFVELEQQQSKYESSTVSLRTQIAKQKQIMATMTEGTLEYADAMRLLGVLQDQYGDITAQGRVMADDEKNIKATTETIQGLSGAMSAGVGVASLFGASQEKLQEIQTRLQSVMAVSMGINQMAVVLNKDSYFSHIILAKAKAADATVTTFLSGAIQKLGLSSGVANVAAKGLMVTLTGGLVVGLWAATAAYNAWNSKQEQAKKKQEELQQASDSFAESAASGAAKSISEYRKLQSAWNELSDSLSKKKKFIQENKGEFDKLGVSISSVADADRIFTDQTDAFVAAMMARAKAAAAAELAQENFKKQIENQIKRDAVSKKVIAGKRELDQPSKVDAPKYSFTGGMNSGAIALPSVGGKHTTEQQLIKDVKAYNDLTVAIRESEQATQSYYKVADRERANELAILNGAGIKPTTGSGKEDKVFNSGTLAYYDAEIEKLKSLQSEYATTHVRWQELQNKIGVLEFKKEQIKDPYGFDEFLAKFHTDREKGRLEMTKPIELPTFQEETQQVKDDTSFNDYLAKYGDFQQRKEAITRLYAERISKASGLGEGLILQQERDQAIQGASNDLLQKSDAFKVLFDNLGDFDISKIDQALTDARALLDKAQADPTTNAADLQAMYEAIDKAEVEIRQRNPFKALADSIKQYKKEKEKGGDVTKSTKDMAASTGASLDLLKGGFDAVTGGLAKMGLAGDEVTQQLLGDIGAMAGSAAEVAKGIATGNPLAIIQGSIGLITSAFDVFDGQSRRAARQVKAHEEQLKKLRREYDALGREVQKAIGVDQYAKTIDQAVNLQRQITETEGKIAAEGRKRRRKRDKAAIEQWKDDIVKIRGDIEDLKQGVIDELMTTDLRTWSSDIASSMVDGVASGVEDLRGVLDGKMDDLVRSMIAKQFDMMVVQKAYADMFSLAGKYFDEKSQDGFGLSEGELQSIVTVGEQAKDKVIAGTDGLKKLLERLGLMNEDAIKKADELKGGASGALQAALTEGTASHLLGTANMIALDARATKESVVGIHDMMVGGFKEIAAMAKNEMLIERNTRNTVTELQNGFKTMGDKLDVVASKMNGYTSRV